MGNLGGSTRRQQPLHVIVMAACLVLAAFLGASLGFLMDFLGGDDPVEAPASPEQEPES